MSIHRVYFFGEFFHRKNAYNLHTSAASYYMYITMLKRGTYFILDKHNTLCMLEIFIFFTLF